MSRHNKERRQIRRDIKKYDATMKSGVRYVLSPHEQTRIRRHGKRKLAGV